MVRISKKSPAIKNTDFNQKSEINELFNRSITENPDMNNPNTYNILDSTRHSFNTFDGGDILNMYLLQENQSYSPKIIINRKLNPNTIEKLPEEVTIYRGCHKNELTSKFYRQAWTTEKSIAEEFAFNHYAHDAGFNRSERVVLQAQIRQDDVYYYDENRPEKEVVVNPDKLINVKCVN